MRFIDKRNIPIPNKLSQQGAQKTAKLKQDFDAGITTFMISSKIYGDKTVKESLKKAQKSKCCFCEAYVSDVAHGDIEHYRPKKGYIKFGDTKMTKPGYFWLAYSFDNLYFSCQICNQKFKRNYFPLIDESKRADHHSKDITREEPMIIDPGKDDPNVHLTFNREVVVHLTDRGKETIKRAGLNRKEICERRSLILENVKYLEIIIRANLPQKEEAIDSLKKLIDDQYTMMIKSEYRQLIDDVNNANV